MSEIQASIFNIVTMICLVLFAGYLSSVLGEQKISLFKRLIHCVFKWTYDPIEELKEKKFYLWIYLIIPSLLVNVLAIARQFNIGKMYIRADLGFIASSVLWIALPMLYIGALNRLKKEEDKNK